MVAAVDAVVVAGATLPKLHRAVGWRRQPNGGEVVRGHTLFCLRQCQFRPRLPSVDATAQVPQGVNRIGGRPGAVTVLAGGPEGSSICKPKGRAKYPQPHNEINGPRRIIQNFG